MHSGRLQMPPSRPDDVDWTLTVREPTIADLIRDTEASDPHAELLARYEALRRAEAATAEARRAEELARAREEAVQV